MAKKSGNFIEEHIEKLAPVFAILVCIYPLYKYVLSNRYAFELDGRGFRPGQLDLHISEEAERLKQKLNREPEMRDYSEPCSPVFAAKLEGKWHAINTKSIWPAPFSAEQKFDREYRLPVVGQINNIAVEHIRAVAYVPKVAVTPANVSNRETYELNDVDLVTVQGDIDVVAITDSFEECFAGEELPEEWRDPSLAHPVFAAVQLQRQRLNADGQWSDWEEVPRGKTDVQRDEFSTLEDVNRLPIGGVTIRRLRIGDPQTQANLLQPAPYQMASVEEMWFPPSLHRRFLAVQREKEAKERRETIAAGNEEQSEERSRTRPDERERSRTDRDRRTRTSRETSTSSSGPSGRGGDMSGGGGTRSTTRIARPERERRVEQPLPEPLSKTVKPADDTALYDEFNKMLLTGENVEAPRESTVFWAHDDTAVPGNSYRYRVRVGVFNPVAGTGQVRPEDAAYENKAILWSDFSEITETVAIPRRIYFFPMNVQEAAKSVDIQVCKYILGYWYSEQFMVKRGEQIGKAVKVTLSEDKQKQEQIRQAEQGFAPPETIDYTTGAVLVDLVAVNDWSSDKNLQSRQYFDILYSFDGSAIERMAAKLMYWPDEARVKYSEIKTLEKRPKTAFREWSSEGGLGIQRGFPASPTTAPPGRGGDMDPRMRMMMDDMMRSRGGQPQRQQ